MKWLKRLLCALRGHGGITHIRQFGDGTATGVCKRCGSEVEL